MTTRTCASCGSNDLLPGVIVESGDGTRVTTWMPGRPEFGGLGNLKMRGRKRHYIDAHGCRECGYLNLYIGAEH